MNINSTDECSKWDKAAFSVPLLSRNLDDLAIPGVIVEMTPDMAESFGLVFEDAVTFDVALDANADNGVRV